MRIVSHAVVMMLLLSGCGVPAQTSAELAAKPKAAMPWMNKTLSSDERARLLLKQLTLDQKIQLMHGTGDPHVGPADPHAAEGNGGSGYVPGFPEYDVPGLQIDDSAYGVAYSAGSGRYSTALPSNLAAAASWDVEVAKRYGVVIGQELRDQGYNMSLGGGVNLAREPRDARTFEYEGEDPLLAGTMVGSLIQGVQSTHVIGDIKHYAVNDQESGRHAVSSNISERVMRETDLLAFQIGVEEGKPGAVMCAYNRVNGTYACENDFLLKTVLKGDWKFPGFVISDWLATHSTAKALHAGLDQEQPDDVFYGPALKKAVESGEVPQGELDDHVHRILRTMFEAGVVDDPPKKRVPDVFGHAKIAREIEQRSMVLLRNEHHVLPIDAARVRTIAVIGRNADRGMISGGGSAQVDPPNGNAIGEIAEKEKKADWQKAIWFPDSPLEAIKTAAPGVAVRFNDGADARTAADVARGADVVLFYAYQWQAEGLDLPSLALPDGQDAVIAALAKANPNVIVVLETGGPVLMPWIKDVAGVVETWYSGTSGAEAISDVLFGKTNPSGKLPITFPLTDADLPHPKLVEPPTASQEDWSDEDKMSRKLLAGLPSFDVAYDEGLEVGYKWYDAKKKPVLFPFGFGLSYTTFAYSNLKIEQGVGARASFTVRNTGDRTGEEIAEVYTAMPESSGEPPKRLVGWLKISLQSGEAKDVTVNIPEKRLAIWDEHKERWSAAKGSYPILVGPSSEELPLRREIEVR